MEDIASLTSDSDGEASTSLDTGIYHIELSSSQYEPEEFSVAIDGDLTLERVLSGGLIDPGQEQDQDTTGDDGTFELFLVDGEYLLVADHPDYWAYQSTIDVDGEDIEYDIELEDYGDAVDTSGLTEIDTLETDSDGEGRFEDVEYGDYVLEFEKDGYRTKTVRQAHSSGSDVEVQLQADDILDPPELEDPDRRDPPEAGSPQGTDPGFDLPSGPAYFECAVLETEIDSAFELPVLVTNTGGETGATDVRVELDTSGRIISTRDITLVAGGVAITRLPMREILRHTSLPTGIRVSTVDDSESFALEESGDIREIEHRGLPARVDGTATVGADNPFTVGPIREPPEPRGVSFPQEGWALTLEKANGETRELTRIIDSPDIEDTHTELSQWSVDVPADPSLEQWKVKTRATLTRHGRIVNIGWVDSIDSTTSDQVSTITGSGPLADLTGDQFDFGIQRNWDYRAAERFIEMAEDWDITVVQPDDPIFIKDESYSGSLLDIITSFCQDYGLFLRPSQTNFGQATIYPPGGVSESVEYTLLNYEQNDSSEGYANRVVFRGDGFEVTEPDDEEIRRLAEEQDIRVSDARETVLIEDDEEDSEEKGRAKAKAELRERIMSLETGGELTTTARRFLPGVAYPLPTDTEVWHSARSVRFIDDGYISIPETVIRRMDRNGSIAIAVKGEWSDISSDEAALFGAWGSDGDSASLRTVNADLDLRVTLPSDSEVELSPFEDGPNDDEWHLVHYDWAWDSDDEETVLRAGHDGTVVDTETIGDPIETTAISDVAVGRVAQDYLRETLVESVVFGTAPLTEERYERLSRGESIPATNLLSRFDLNETPGEDTAFDALSGYHGERTGEVRSAGRPAILQSADHSLTETSAQFDRQTTYVDALREVFD